MTQITDMQMAILTALTKLTVEQGRAPTLNEVAQRTPCHRNTAWIHLDALSVKGLVLEQTLPSGHSRYRPTPFGFPKLELVLAKAAIANAVEALSSRPELQAQAEAIRAELERASA